MGYNYHRGNDVAKPNEFVHLAPPYI